MKLSANNSTGNSLVLYGAPKTGKTQLIGKLAEVGWKIKILDFDCGIKTLVNSVPKQYHNNIEFLSVSSTKLVPRALEVALTAFTKTGPSYFCTEHQVNKCKYCNMPNAEAFEWDYTPRSDTIYVLDSMTALTNALVFHYGGPGKDDDESFRLEFKEWAFVTGRCTQILANIKNSGCNTIITAHAEIQVDDLARTTISPFAGTSKFSAKWAGDFDHIVYTEIKAAKDYGVYSMPPRAGIQVGTRSGIDISLPTHKANPLAAIFGVPK